MLRRLRLVCRRGRPAGLFQVEHRPAVVGEVDLALAAGHEDAVREEEVRAEQHVVFAQVHARDAQPGALHLLAADLDAQVLVLLPEIALTQAVIARFEARFGARPAVALLLT